MDDAHEQARHVIKQAQAAARRGDFTAADRWSKTAERLALAAARLNDNPPPADEAADEQLATELLQRLEHYAACDRDIQAWEHERDIHNALTAYAERHGTAPPEPLRPCPASDETLRQIAMGERSWSAASLPPALR